MNPVRNHQGQKQIWKNDARFKVLVAGRRWGKTILIREQLLKYSEKPHSTVVYVAPTRIQAKDIMWNQLKQRVQSYGWACKTNEAELKITRANKSTIELKSAEKPGRLRGRGIDFISFDEFAEYRTAEIWNQVARPALSDKRGKAFFAMTPKGFNHGYDIFNQAKTNDNWACYQFKTLESPFFQTDEGKAELQEAKDNLSERDYRQEYEASFENFAGRIYYAFDRTKNYTDNVYKPNQPVIIGMDFNRSPMTAVTFQKAGQGELHAVDEIFLQSSDTPEICRTIQHRYPTSQVFIRPDSTGSRTYSVRKDLSDHAILREHGFIVQVRTNPSKVDRWAGMNRAFEKQWVKVNVDKCPRFVKDCEVICYKEGTCEPMLNDPMLGHISDAGGYAVHQEFPIVGKIKIDRYV